MPGSSLPSSNSSEAPPPVDTKDTCREGGREGGRAGGQGGGSGDEGTGGGEEEVKGGGKTEKQKRRGKDGETDVNPSTLRMTRTAT